ncbi:MAG TPA: hypothetical protein ENI56_00115 [Candidatus Kaiserbacteria bacterium]|nr:hypothetical protein [Candidatus Kaiserbacteria bacterium]
MRIDNFSIDSVMHVTQRGARGLDIVRDNNDRTRFMQSLLYLNDTHTDPYWHRTVAKLPNLARPSHWPEREPLVRIFAWTLLPNHFHILLQELTEGGTAKFMQRLGGSMSVCFNAKYSEKGSLFQGSYHARAVIQDEHHRYLAFYILVKNVLEMYSGGLSAATNNFDKAWEWAKQYPYSSLRSTASGVASPIVDDPDELVKSIIGTGDAYKKEARELLSAHLEAHGNDFKDIMLES